MQLRTRICPRNNVRCVAYARVSMIRWTRHAYLFCWKIRLFACRDGILGRFVVSDHRIRNLIENLSHGARWETIIRVMIFETGRYARSARTTIQRSVPLAKNIHWYVICVIELDELTINCIMYVIVSTYNQMLLRQSVLFTFTPVFVQGKRSDTIIKL